jgi:hypothetical protein
MSIAEILSMLPSMSDKEKITLKKALEIEPNDDLKPADKKKKYRKAGSLKHLEIKMSEDFDKPLEDMAEYM